MKLYHGSYTEITKIDLKRSIKGKDFGQGFYLSQNYEQAKGIAVLRSIGMKVAPVVNVYEFDEKFLNDGSLKTKRFDGYTVEWAEFVLANRRNKEDLNIHDYDIVIGPIANDRVGLQIRRLLDEEINMQEFLNRLKYMKGITFQYFFGTEKAIKCLISLGCVA